MACADVAVAVVVVHPDDFLVHWRKTTSDAAAVAVAAAAAAAVEIAFFF